MTCLVSEDGPDERGSGQQSDDGDNRRVGVGIDGAEVDVEHHHNRCRHNKHGYVGHDLRPADPSEPDSPVHEPSRMLESTSSPRSSGGVPLAKTVDRNGGNHGAVVGAHADRRDVQLDPAPGGFVTQSGAQPSVGEDTTTTPDGRDTRLLHRVERLLHEDVHDGLLDGGCHVGARRQSIVVSRLLEIGDDRGLEPREREVERTIPKRPREHNRGRVAIFRLGVDGRSSGVSEADESGEFVERLPRGVVDRRAKRLVVAPVAHVDDLAMAAGCKENHGRRFVRREFETGGVEMALHVVDAVERLLERPRQRFAEGESHHQRSDQTRTLGRSDGVELIGVNPGDRKCLVDQRPNRFDVCPGRHFRHHTTKSCVLLGLGRQHERADVESLEDGDTRLVAAGLDPEDEWFGHADAAFRSERISSRRVPYSSASTSSAHMTMASSPW